jgi:hypothetical protein
VTVNTADVRDARLLSNNLSEAESRPDGRQFFYRFPDVLESEHINEHSTGTIGKKRNPSR